MSNIFTPGAKSQKPSKICKKKRPDKPDFPGTAPGPKIMFNITVSFKQFGGGPYLGSTSKISTSFQPGTWATGGKILTFGTIGSFLADYLISVAALATPNTFQLQAIYTAFGMPGFHPTSTPVFSWTGLAPIGYDSGELTFNEGPLIGWARYVLNSAEI